MEGNLEATAKRIEDIDGRLKATESYMRSIQLGWKVIAGLLGLSVPILLFGAWKIARSVVDGTAVAAATARAEQAAKAAATDADSIARLKLLATRQIGFLWDADSTVKGCPATPTYTVKFTRRVFTKPPVVVVTVAYPGNEADKRRVKLLEVTDSSFTVEDGNNCDQNYSVEWIAVQKVGTH